LIFPVLDSGEEHVAGLSGSTGTHYNQMLCKLKVKSQSRFADVATRSVDALLWNHQVGDHAVQNADILAYSGSDAGYPFVVGVEGFANYMRINVNCSQVIAARQGLI
jgi:hypothetical protein